MKTWFILLNVLLLVFYAGAIAAIDSKVEWRNGPHKKSLWSETGSDGVTRYKRTKRGRSLTQSGRLQLCFPDSWTTSQIRGMSHREGLTLVGHPIGRVYRYYPVDGVDLLQLATRLSVDYSLDCAAPPCGKSQ